MSLETLDITLSSVVFHGPSKFNPSGVPYLIARASNGTTIKGEMRKPVSGERYRLWGEWKPQKPYNGRPSADAFEFSEQQPIIDQSEAGFASYLRNYVDGLGIVKATAIVEHFGTDTLTVLRETPERALEVHGMNEVIVESIRKHFGESTEFDPAAYAALVDLFGPFKVPKKVIKTLLKDFGSDAPQIVREKPYILLAFPRLGWKTVDSFATGAVGYPADGIERHKAAIVEALEQIANDGHTYGSKVDIERITFGLIGMRPVESSWGAATSDQLITAIDDDTFALPKLAEAENTIAERIATLSATGVSLPFGLSTDGLEGEQIDAVKVIEENPVAILEGPPGTGKTHTITQVLASLVENGFKSIRIVTPTGKAAKRAEELLTRALPDSGIESSTIHRALGPVPSCEPEGVPRGDAKMNRGREEFGFYYGASNPMESQVIVADESSMIDAKLGSSLLQAVANGSRLILVGDPHQLTSVGPGSVLRDLKAAGVPTASLSTPRRNSGRIVRACHAILKGEAPEPASKVDLEAGENWIHLEMSDPHQIAKQIVQLHASAKKNGKFDPMWDMQVISPEKKKEGVGVYNLNRVLSDLLNTYKAHDPNKIASDDMGKPPVFEVADKVIRTKNGIADQMLTEAQHASLGGGSGQTYRWENTRYHLEETDVVNGDMGMIRAINKDSDNWHVIVQFESPYRLCRLSYGDCHLEPAYAVTCHKAQGSGFPYVVAPVHTSFYAGLWNREMIYTIFSRAEKLLVTVGPFSAITAAVGRQTIHARKTRLRSLVQPHFIREDSLA